jgi:two-component system chemotaxis response regulator CheY
MPVDKNTKILLIDDFAKVRKITKNILENLGFKNIIEAEDGIEAIEILKNMEIDLILTDWNMPNISGLDLVKIIRNSEKLKHIPIIMISAEALKENIAKAINAGVDDYIVKPFTKSTLAQKIEKVFFRKLDE